MWNSFQKNKNAIPWEGEPRAHKTSNAGYLHKSGPGADFPPKVLLEENTELLAPLLAF